ncbi:hypothetical protein GCM10023231_21220 [Olivibacter ginsenosidimutans]|uniref:Entericidin n=1 Tax=Olivibacter ginsenosidimutans TaxID=1176537 RepID=A0ABP9BAN4_9SPHI
MKKLMFTAVIAAMVFAGCNNRQNGDNTDGMGAGDGTDTTGMYQEDTSTTTPVDTAIDTTAMP